MAGVDSVSVSETSISVSERLSLGFPLSVVKKSKSRSTRHGDIGSVDTGSALESNSSVSDSGVSESVSEVGLSLSLPLSVVKVAGHGHVSGIDTGSALKSSVSDSRKSFMLAPGDNSFAEL